ncbi:ribonuclease HII [Gellertiella hungarica]|uniref:Ribonuclease HII n=1 Tax=Gellertiella hungarica TaxID=1572859 RepID=A0A7W6J3X1_9HYPH|nr:ribonuclease HII [Gellertiella hungarica]MBB4064351.1 ribonuclease HII [Gellertiella hungarica]
MTRRTPPDSPALFELLANKPDFNLERALMRDGYSVVAGADEAGRGPLAGPVVAAAVILDPDNIPDGLNDSKKLSAAQRNAIYSEVLRTSMVAIASSGPRRIDDTDILKASLDAMRRAACSLALRPDFLLVDGRDVPPGLPFPGKAVVKGDSRSLSIAAASIVAKVTRDRMMEQAGTLYSVYGFEIHAGYATSFHREQIALHGPCPLHRMSFRPIALFAQEDGQQTA